VHSTFALVAGAREEDDNYAEDERDNAADGNGNDSTDIVREAAGSTQRESEKGSVRHLRGAGAGTSSEDPGGGTSGTCRGIGDNVTAHAAFRGRCGRT
jgi:hypothetical protein